MCRTSTEPGTYSPGQASLRHSNTCRTRVFTVDSSAAKPPLSSRGRCVFQMLSYCAPPLRLQHLRQRLADVQTTAEISPSIAQYRCSGSGGGLLAQVPFSQRFLSVTRIAVSTHRYILFMFIYTHAPHRGVLTNHGIQQQQGFQHVPISTQLLLLVCPSCHTVMGVAGGG